MRLYAIIGNLRKSEDLALMDVCYLHAREVSEAYLNQLVNPEQCIKYLQIFEFHYKNLQRKKFKHTFKRVSVYSVKTLLICEQINYRLDERQKVFLLLQLLDILKVKNVTVAEESLEFVQTIAESLGVCLSDYQLLLAFVHDKYSSEQHKDLFMIISGGERQNKFSHHIFRDNLIGWITVFYYKNTQTYYFRHEGFDDELQINGHDVVFKRIYQFNKGSAIRCPKIQSIHYSDVAGSFLKLQRAHEVVLSAENIEFHFKNSLNGIKKFNFQATGGQLIGIMGGSGVGKSTLLQILNGTLKPDTGKISVNGFDIYTEKNKIEGIIGFIPQDDFLVEELTVYENLYFNARFCYSTLSESEIEDKVDNLLKDLDLFDIKELKVGSSLNKFISGGQRKRLNIALELLREPYILFVDEPTSGLSSNDSGNVMDLFKNQTYNGKLVIVNIHQPSSDIFKMFDNVLIIDKGGSPVYYGNAIDSIVYFKTATQMVNANEGECIWCGNLNPEQILHTLEVKEFDLKGRSTGKRMISAEEWYQLYLSTIDPKQSTNSQPNILPPTLFKLPGRFKQFLIYSFRNLLTKAADKQYLFINLLEAPALAFILSFLTRYVVDVNGKDTYVFSENLNIPAFLFMSVIVSLFLGLMGSAEEIIKDAKLLKRESFLNLSRRSYINSKVIYLFMVSAFQMIVYVIISNLILGIQGMTFTYWLILFSTSCFASILGLNISATMKSVVAIYILIPLLLIPQILLSGIIVKYDKLHSSLKSDINVPVIGDIMASRWAYEALAVAQFKNNKYQTHFFDVEKKEADATYCTNYWVPELTNRLSQCEIEFEQNNKSKDIGKNLALIQNEFARLAKYMNVKPFEKTKQLNLKTFNTQVSSEAREYLRLVRSKSSGKIEDAIQEKDNIIEKLHKGHNNNNFLLALKQENFNNSLADQVLNKSESEKIVETKGLLFRKYEPIYTFPELKNGRAHFYSPVKILGKYYIDTVWFNIIILWIMSLMFYFLLITNFFSRVLNYFKNQES
jgi:ABC-type multidrug transport system ATPase subunit